MSDQRLLALRISNLNLKIEDTPIHRRIKALYRELERKGITFKPHVWLSDEFFTPDGVPGFAVPFYLAHPRLRKLERKIMLEVEGGTEQQLMKVLRHEAGHALDHAYRIHLRKTWRKIFGSVSRPYPKSYKPKPGSRDYVLHLDAWYAQAHPLEDFAETFAVVLKPQSRWRSRYKGWPAYQKLEYVDSLIKELAGKKAVNRTRLKDETLSEKKMTLREYYRLKRKRYSVDYRGIYDRDLRRLFSDDPRYAGRESAVRFLRRFQRELRKEVSEGTGVHPYAVNYTLKNIIERARNLRLRVSGSERHTKRQALILLTFHTTSMVLSGRYRSWYGI
jgi:Putative zinc-binding metallo-peptidase